MKSNERTERIKIEQSNLNASTSHHLNIFSTSHHLNIYSTLSDVGRRQASCNTSATMTMPPSTAKPMPRLPPFHLPSRCVTAAPANTPTIFITP